MRARGHPCARASERSFVASARAPALTAPAARRGCRFGEKVALTELGPIIVNTDCSMRRIDNWAEMTERERQATQARVSKRNAARLERCRALEAAGELGGGGGGGLMEAEADARGEL